VHYFTFALKRQICRMREETIFLCSFQLKERVDKYCFLSLSHFFVHTLEHTYGGKFDNTFSLSLSVCLSFPSSLSFCLIVSSLNGAEKGFGVSFWVQNCKLQSSHICPVKTRVKIILYIQPTPTCANLHLYRN
jgi:hypothetical protein